MLENAVLLSFKGCVISASNFYFEFSIYKTCSINKVT
jgi:hypothetical protein